MFRMLATGVSTALAFAACTSVSGLPTHRLAGEGPTALMLGTLVDRNDCVFIQSPAGEQHLVIWPAGFGRIGSQIVIGTNPVAQVGEIVELGGGSYSDDVYDWLRTSVLNGDIPDRCRSAQYWLATDVDPLPPE
jgi:hypothetical protein